MDASSCQKLRCKCMFEIGDYNANKKVYDKHLINRNHKNTIKYNKIQ